MVVQDCKFNRRFQASPELLKGKWVLLLRRNRNQVRLEGPFPCEIIAVGRREATLMEIWSRPHGTQPVAVGGFLTGLLDTSTPPRTFSVSLSTLLDPYSGFSYLGPRSKFAWIAPGALCRSKNRYRRNTRYAIIENIVGTLVHVTFVPRRFREHIQALNRATARRQVEAGGLQPPEPAALGRGYWLWELSKAFRQVERASRGEAVRDWEQTFRQDHADLVPPEFEMEDAYALDGQATEIRRIFHRVGLPIPHHTDQQLIQLREHLRASAPAGSAEVPALAPPALPDPPDPPPNQLGPTHWERLRQR
jgi:hypothetical protein